MKIVKYIQIAYNLDDGIYKGIIDFLMNNNLSK